MHTKIEKIIIKNIIATIEKLIIQKCENVNQQKKRTIQTHINNTCEMLSV